MQHALLFSSLLLLLATPCFADVDPDAFCHDYQGYAAGVQNDAHSKIATFWQNRDGLYELRIAGPDLIPGLTLPNKTPVKYINSVVVVFHEGECEKNAAASITTCFRHLEEDQSPIWAWGDDLDPLSAVHPVDKHPESTVQSKSIYAVISSDVTLVRFKTVDDKAYHIDLDCGTPSWEWYPHIPLDELGSKAH